MVCECGVGVAEEVGGVIFKWSNEAIRVVWAEESKNGLRFEIGPSYDSPQRDPNVYLLCNQAKTTNAQVTREAGDPTRRALHSHAGSPKRL